MARFLLRARRLRLMPPPLGFWRKLTLAKVLNLCYTSSVVQRPANGPSSMNCERCGKEIPEARRIAVPDERWCRDCVLELGDVDLIKGAMIYEHKTGGYLETTGNVGMLLANSRKGVHAQLPMASKTRAEISHQAALINSSQRPELVIDLKSTAPASRCHPDRPRVNPNGQCLECCLKWYEDTNRLRRRS